MSTSPSPFVSSEVETPRRLSGAQATENMARAAASCRNSIEKLNSSLHDFMFEATLPDAIRRLRAAIDE